MAEADAPAPARPRSTPNTPKRQRVKDGWQAPEQQQQHQQQQQAEEEPRRRARKKAAAAATAAAAASPPPGEDEDDAPWINPEVEGEAPAGDPYTDEAFNAAYCQLYYDAFAYELATLGQPGPRGAQEAKPPRGGGQAVSARGARSDSEGGDEDGDDAREGGAPVSPGVLRFVAEAAAASWPEAHRRLLLDPSA